MCFAARANHVPGRIGCLSDGPTRWVNGKGVTVASSMAVGMPAPRRRVRLTHDRTLASGREEIGGRTSLIPFRGHSVARGGPLSVERRSGEGRGVASWRDSPDARSEDGRRLSTWGRLSMRVKALRYHAVPRPGKIQVQPSKPSSSAEDLALAYTPGVAAPCLAIRDSDDASFEYTSRGNLVGVISNGTAVLGLGNVGPLAAKPVMEGRCL